MKKIYLLSVLIVMAVTMKAQRMVLFSVDMTGTTLAATDTIKLGAEFTTTPWTPSDKANALKKQGTTNVWAGTFAVPVGVAKQYKFVINTWGTNEFTDKVNPPGGCAKDDGSGNINRIITVPAGTDVYRNPVFKYNICDTIKNTLLNNQDLRSTTTTLLAPNPMSNVSYLTFDNPRAEAFQVNLSNLVGQVVRSYSTVRGGVVEIQRNQLSTGIYFVRLTDESGKSLTEKLVIE